MHSVAIVESPSGSGDERAYLVAIMSDVRKVNSAVEHQTIAAGIERLIQATDPRRPEVAPR